jgi:hypothetical protein
MAALICFFTNPKLFNWIYYALVFGAYINCLLVKNKAL